MSRFFRAIPGATVTLVLLVVSFAIIVQSTAYKTSFVSKLPPTDLCGSQLHELYNIPQVGTPADTFLFMQA